MNTYLASALIAASINIATPCTAAMQSVEAGNGAVFRFEYTYGDNPNRRTSVSIYDEDSQMVNVIFDCKGSMTEAIFAYSHGPPTYRKQHIAPRSVAARIAELVCNPQ